MATLDRRIIGPSHNRLLLVVPDNYPKPSRTSYMATHTTAEQLIKAGWTEYTGPATTDRGWVVPGSDPSLKPRSTIKR